MLRITKKGDLLYQVGERWYKVTEDAKDYMTNTYFNFCTIDEGTTLKAIFRLIKKGGLGETFRCEFDAFYAEMRKKPSKDDSWSSGDYLEVYWSPYVEQDWDSDDDNETLIDCMANFHAIRPDEDFKQWSISFSPVCSYKHLEVKLNNTFDVAGEDNKTIIKTKRRYTFNEIVSSIMWEISWYGEPSDRDEKGAELDIAIEEVKSGTAKLIPYKTLGEALELSSSQKLEEDVKIAKYELDKLEDELDV